MTTSRITVRNPEHAVALVPHLLGFRPENSAIAIWVRDGAIALTQRADLPDPGEPDQADRFAGAFVELAGAAQADAVILLACAEHPASEWVEHVMTAMVHAVEDEGVEVLDCLAIWDERYRSLLCDAECCPKEGREITPAVRDEVAAAFALAGTATFASRQEIERSMAADPVHVARVQPLVAEDDADCAAEITDGAALEAWRDRRIEDIRQSLRCGPEITDAQTARLLSGLDDIRVRDTLSWHLSREDDLRPALDALIVAMRSAPPGCVAPVACCTGMVAWCIGDGARASIALDRSLADDPGYVLAQLLARAVHAGLPPAGWRQALADMAEDDMRMRVRHPAA